MIFLIDNIETSTGKRGSDFESSASKKHIQEQSNVAMGNGGRLRRSFLAVLTHCLMERTTDRAMLLTMLNSLCSFAHI